jgi:hypothetical protein
VDHASRTGAARFLSHEAQFRPDGRPQFVRRVDLWVLANRAGGNAQYVPMSNPLTALRRGRLRPYIGALALFAVLCRALIPIGFMPGVVHGAVQLMPCDGTAHLHARHGEPAPPSTNHTPCPFAMSGGAAPLPATIDASDARTAPQRAALPTEQSLLPEAPARYTAPRGPPLLA